MDPVALPSWRHVLLGRDSFFPVLLVAVATILVSPMIEAFHFGFLAVDPISALLVLLAHHRSLAIFEAILGQVFLVTAVARSVSLLGSEKPTVPNVRASRDFTGDEESD